MPPENPEKVDSSIETGKTLPPAGLSESAVRSAETVAGPPPPVKDGVSAQDWIGRSLGKYEIVGVLGEGGMGVVLKARDPMIERDVAIKVLADHLAADATALNRFLAEAKSAGKLNHPNVMAIYEISKEGPTHYLVLEYVAGGSLDDRLKDQRGMSVVEATQALIDVCKGVGAAHAAGLIHRDIKPANFMRAADGSIRVADFGLAKGANPGRNLTQTGTVVGTPFFMSPEQCEAGQLDHRSDIYSLGATYYSLLTGQNPYEDTGSMIQVMFAHCQAAIPDPRAVNSAIPEACSRIVARAMAKAPGDRYQSTSEMLADLQALLATISGQTWISLPSESSTAPARAADTQTSARPRAGRRLLYWAAACGAALLVAAVLIAWRPWATSPGAPPVSGEPIKVGVLHSLSGSMANSEAAVVNAVLFAIDEVNQAGGVLGRKVKAVIADGRSDPDTFAAEAKRLIEQEKVATVFGCWTSASRKAVRPVIENQDHLLIYPLQFEGLETSPCIFYVGAAPNQQILPALDWAAKMLKSKRFFLVGSDYVFPRAANAIIKDYFKLNQGQVVGEEYIPLGSQEVEGIVSAIAKAKADMILNTLNGDSNVSFFRALRKAGIASNKVPTLSFSIDEQGMRSLNPAKLAGDYVAWTYVQSLATPENEEFVRRFHSKYPQHIITDPMETAYVGVKLWAKAVGDAETLEPRKIRRALLNQRFKGPCGEIRIDPDTQYCFRTPRICRIDPSGHFKVVWTSPQVVRPDPYPATRSAEAWQAFLHDLHRGWGNSWSAPQ